MKNHHHILRTFTGEEAVHAHENKQTGPGFVRSTKRFSKETSLLLEPTGSITYGRAFVGTGMDSCEPAKVLALGVRKQILFLGDDAQGAFETLKRGLGIQGLRYAAWKRISNLYRWFLWLLIFLALIVHWRLALTEEVLHAPIFAAVLYLLAIHSAFESGA
jgi:hypothetical protein